MWCVAPKLSFQPYRNPWQSGCWFRESSSLQCASPEGVTDLHQWGLSQPLVCPAWLQCQEEFCGSCSHHPPCKAEATKACQRCLTSAKKNSTALSLCKSLIFPLWASLLSSALCCAPSSPQPMCVLGRDAQHPFQGAQDELLGSDRAVQVLFQDYSWKQDLSWRRWVERPKRPLVVNVTTEISGRLWLQTWTVHFLFPADLRLCQ